MKAVWGLFLLAAVPCAAQTESKNPFAGDPQAVEAGRGTFRIYCSPCHGIKGEGGRGPDLTLGSYSAGNEDGDLYRVIAQGVPGTEMPDFAVRLGGDNVWRVVTYIRSIARRETRDLPGDKAAGERLFWGKGACGQCHRAGARGGRLGPDLTMVGRQRSLAYLRESLVDPSANLTPGYATITVVVKSGAKIVGTERGYDNFSVQLMDARENLHSFFRSDVQSVEREVRSLMPDNYGKLLGPSELDDLLSYMVSLRGGGATQ